MIAALAGGVGGARLAAGLAAILPPEELAIVVNTGDDFEHLGLHISPDPDTVMYTLSGLADEVRGWGLKGESWNFIAAVKRLGGDNWFALGDTDLATHVERTRRLRAGETLSQVTADLSRRLGVAHAITPMSDDPMRTTIHSGEGALAFQDYFVRRRCEPVVRSITYAGVEDAQPSPGLRALMDSPDLDGVIICPSNPHLSIAPILALPGVRAWLEGRRFPVLAVSPIIGGQAVKGPAAKIMRELNLPVTQQSIADHYAGLIDGLVIDNGDVGEVTPGGRIRCFPTDALMRDAAGRQRLASEAMGFLAQLRAGAHG